MSHARKSRTGEKIIETALLACGMLSIFTTVGIIGVLLFETIGFFKMGSVVKELSVIGFFVEFFTDTQWTPLFVKKHFGILPLVTGTALTSGIAILVAGPLGILTAIFLSEYAPARLRQIIKPTLEILAGVPTIVYGYFALLFVTPLLKKLIPDLSGFNALSPGLVMGIMIVPLVSSLSEDAMYAVPPRFARCRVCVRFPRVFRQHGRSSCRRRSPELRRPSSSRFRVRLARPCLWQLRPGNARI